LTDHAFVASLSLLLTIWQQKSGIDVPSSDIGITGSIKRQPTLQPSIISPFHLPKRSTPVIARYTRLSLTPPLSLGQFQVPVRTADRLSCTIRVEVRQQAKAATAAAASAAAASEPKAAAAATASAASPVSTSPAPAAANTAPPAATAAARKKTDKQLQGTKHAAAKKDADGSKA